jgi:hypothetical protein
MATLLLIHSLLRWIILAVALLAMIRFAVGWLRGGPFSGMDRGLVAGFTGMMDLQLLLGLILLVILGITMPRIEHALPMVVAVAGLHATARWRKGGDDRMRFRNNLIAIVIALVLVVMGVTSIGGW